MGFLSDMIMEKESNELIRLSNKLQKAYGQQMENLNELERIKTERNQWELEAKKYCAELGEMKILEEQGLLVKLPCKVGTPIWYIRYCEAPSCKRCGFICADNSCYQEYKARIFKDKFSLFYLNAFGRSVFLTKEEAEKALEGSGAE